MIGRVSLDYVFKGLLLFAIYYITAWWGLKQDAVSGFATLIWLPTGISLAALLVWGIKFWPFIYLGAFFANITAGAPPPVAFGIGFGNSLEAIIGAHLFRRLGARITFDRVQDVLGLIFVAFLSTSISATVGVTSLFFGKVIPLSETPFSWSAWWIGDIISDLIIAPFILVWVNRPNISFLPKRIGEELIVFFLLTLISLGVFTEVFDIDKNSIKYLIFPPLIWIALRFSQRAAISAVFIVSTIIIFSTLRVEHSIENSISEELFILQGFMSITGITVILLSAAISERKELEKKKDEFISVASHELRTPLTSIKVFAQVLQRSLENNKDKKLFSNIKKLNSQIERLARLVMELLDVSRIQEGKLQLRKERFRLDESVNAIIKEIRDSTNSEIISELDSKLIIRADKDRIEQVVTNLVSNAIKYSPKNKKIIVSVQRKNRSVTLCVQDFGKGIPKYEQKNIFDRFYQINRRGRTNDSGMGLGLYIAKEIIERHKGNIWVESEKNKGSSFYFSLPVGRN